ncbi:MAG: arginine--tRNA ligase [Patescibacteria group bacterium]
MSVKTQTIINQIEKELLKFIEQNFEVKLEKINWETPPELEMGDLAFSCFELARELKQNPVEIATRIATNFKVENLVSKIKNIGPYVNLFFKKDIFCRDLISDVLDEKDNYGRGEKKIEKVMLEGFGQPNTHKAFHIGHLRNIFLSESMSNLLEFSGYQIIRANYYGDVGTHIATWLWYFINYVEDKELILKASKKNIDPELSRKLAEIYTLAKNKVEEVETAQAEISQILQRLESGDKEINKLWKLTAELSLADFRRIFKLLKVSFDKEFFESEVEKPGKKIVQELVDKKIAVESDGAMIVDLADYKLGVLLILKSDGTSLYATKDLALAVLKFNKYKIDRSLYVIDSRQDLYFKQIFKTLELMGFSQAKKCRQLSYGVVALQGGAMASRKGNIILAQDLYDKILDKVQTEISKRENVDFKDVNDVANKITLGALKFGMLKYTPESNITFDWESALKFEGDTGPYLQYTYARIGSIKNKNFKNQKIKASQIDFSLLSTIEEWEVIKAVSEFPQIISKATENYNPATLVNYLLSLSASFNKFYAKCPVAQAESDDLKLARLALIESVGVVLKNGLKILGVEVVGKM